MVVFLPLLCGLRVGQLMVDIGEVVGAPVGHSGAACVGQLTVRGVGCGWPVGHLMGPGFAVAGLLVGHSLFLLSLSSLSSVVFGVLVGHRGAGGGGGVAPVGHTGRTGVVVVDLRDSVGQTCTRDGRVGRPVGQGYTPGGLAVRPVGQTGLRVVGGVAGVG